MKYLKSNLHLTVILILFGLTGWAQDTLKVESKIDKVVVFLKGAQIKRTAKCNLKSGENLINFSKISCQADEKSIQVKSDSSLAIQSVNFRINYLDSVIRIEKTSSLQRRKTDLENESAALENTLYVLKQEQELFKENQVLGGELRVSNTEELKKACEFYRNRLSEIILLRNKTTGQLKKIETEKQSIVKQLNELNTKKEKPVGEIWVVVYANAPVQKEFSIEYFIHDAGWKPKYDIRADSLNKPAVLTYKAEVFQNSDDDWKNVELVLSSSNPSLGGTKPELKSWTLNLNEQYEDNYFQDNSNYQNSVKYYNDLKNNYSDPIKVDNEITISGTIVSGSDGMGLPGVTVNIKGTSIGTISDLEGHYSIKVPKGSQNLVYSFVGMKTEQLPITGTTVNCVLAEEAMALDEVVVIGYGTTRKSDMTGSVATLVPDGNGGFISSSLSGTAPGIRIRGISSSFKEKRKKVTGKTLEGLNKIKENQTSVQFVLDKPYTIPSDNKNYAVDIEKYEIPVHYQYSSVPKLDASAFLLAQLTGWENLNLLSGDVNIYFEGTFIGNSNLDVEKTGDTLDISMGRDKSIIIDRKMKKDFSKNQILSKWKIETYTWEITVKNNKTEKVNLLVDDQVPVSFTKNIEIELIESSNAKFDKNKGELNWKLELEPLEKKILTFSYQIKTKNI